MRFLLIFSLLLSVIFLPAIYAEGNPNDSRSREDTRFEAQLLNAEILDYGRQMSTYRITSSRGKTTSYFDISVETRIKAGDDSCCRREVTKWLAIPIEFRITGNLVNGDVSLKDFKAGAFRALFEDKGVTFQAFSYIMKDHDFNLGTFRGGEVGNLTFNMASEKIKGKSVEIVLKARVGLAVGAFNGNTFIKRTDTDGLFSPDETSFAFNPNAGGSIGVRISNKILVEVFGDVDYYGIADSEHQTTINDQKIWSSLSASFLRSTYGVSLKYIPSPSYNFSLVGQKDLYDTKTSFEKNSAADEERDTSNPVDALSTIATIEIRW